MKTKHTQGEWYVSDIPQEDGFYVYSKVNQFSAIARIYKTNQHAENSEANARLIAAAPELLDALIEINSIIADSSNVEDGKVNLGKLAKISITAIKKAQGE